MVKMAKNHPLRFIAIILGMLVLFAVSSTDLFIPRAAGQAQPGAVEYLHVDAPNIIHAGKPFEIKVGLWDQTGKPVTDKVYGTDFGTFLIPTDGIRNAQGQVPRFDVDSAHVVEIKDEEDKGTGVYKVPVVVSSWPEEQSSNTYSVQVRYQGSGKGAPDNSTNAVYYLTASATFNAEADPEPGVVKYAVPEIDKVTLLVPEIKPNEETPPPKMNTVTFRVKLIGQARSLDGDMTRALRGRALPDQLAKWQAPFVVDNTGNILNASLGEIREEQVMDRFGRVKSLSVYDIPVNIECPAELAGRKAAIRFAFVENGLRMEVSGTVNFAVSTQETKAALNIFYASPYLVEVPHTPTVPDIDFSDLMDDPENSTNRANDTNGNAITNISLFAEIQDPEMRTIVAAEYYIDTYPTAFPLTVGTPSWDVYITQPISTTALYSAGGLGGLSENRHTFYVHGKNQDNQWGPNPKASTFVTIDTTPPTISVTKPADNELVPSTIAYLIEGTSTNPGGAGATLWSAVNRVEVFNGARNQEVWEAGEASSSDFATWYFDTWNTTVITDGNYNLKARVWDNAGNKSADFPRTVRIDNTDPVADIDAPTAGTGFKTSVGNVSLTGTASDINIEGWKIEYALGERSAGDKSGWASVGAGGASGAAYYQSSTTNDEAVFKFNGTGVTWLATKGADKGIAGVYIDGAFDSNIDLFNAAPQYQQSVFTKSGLSAGPHTLKIKVTGTKNVASSGYNVTLDACQVGASTYQEDSPAVSYTPWTSINNGTSTVTAGSLGTWNISGFATGKYTLRLTTKDLAGNFNLDNAPSQPSRIFVYIDDANPSSTVDIPYPGWVDRNLTGTATDLAGANGGNSGVDKVEASIKNTKVGDPDINKYWNWTTGTWASTDPVWNLTNILDFPGETSLKWDDLVPNKTYEWNTYNNVEGWVVGSQVTALAAWGTSLQGESSGAGPYVYSPAGLTINAINNKIIRLRLKTTDASTYGQIYFTTTTDGTWNEAKSRKFTLGTANQWNEYVIDMSSQSGWTGTVNRLRFDPFNITAKTFYIDYLRVGKNGLAGISTATPVLITSRATDEAGNVGTDVGNNVTVDSAPPSTTRSPGPTGANGWYATRPTITLSPDDHGDSGVVSTYYIWTAQTVMTPPNTGWSTGTSAGQPAEGTSRLWFYSTDNVGNAEPANYSNINVDTQLPGTPTITAEPAYTKGLSNTVAWAAVTDPAPSSGGIKYHIQCDDEATFAAPLKGEYDSLTGLSQAFSPLNDGVKYYYRVHSVDTAGNISGWSATVNSAQDNLAPVTTPALVPAAPNGTNNWYTSNVTVNLSRADLPTADSGAVPPIQNSGVQWTKYKVSFNSGAYGADQTGTTYSTVDDGYYDIQYWSADNATANNVETTKTLPQFKVDKAVPTSAISAPAAGARLRATVPISGSASDATSGVGTVQIAIKKNLPDGHYYSGSAWDSDTPVWTVPAFAVTGTTSWSASNDWNTGNTGDRATGAADGDYTIYSKATDNAGNAIAAGDASRVVTVDNTPPTVKSTDPTNLQGLVMTSATVKAVFNEKMDSTTLNSPATNFTLKVTAGGQNVPGSVTYYEQGASYYAIFTPMSALTKSTNYTATITTGAKDVAGNAFAAEYTWTFTTIDIDAEIWLPANNSTVYGTVPIVGKASGGGFKEYTVEYGQGLDPSSWTQIGATHTTAVDSGLMMQTDWIGGATGAGSAPEVVTTNTDKFWYRSPNETTPDTSVSTAGVVRLTPKASFQYRKPVTVNNASGAALSNYQVQVSVSYVSGKMNADYSDIRFTDDDGTSLLDYWIEKSDASTATVWVEVPSIGAGQSNKTIYLYYGCPTAVSDSNIGNTFVYGDDFPGVALDGSWSKAGGVTVSGGWAILNRNAGVDAWIEHSYTGQSSDYVVESKFKLDNVNRNRPKVLKTDGSAIGFDYGIGYQNATNQRDILWNGAWNNANVLSLNTDYLMQYYLKASPWTYYWRVFNYGGSQVFEKSTTNGSGISGYTKMRFEGTENDASDWRFDWVRVRKAATSPPSVGAPGTETSTSLGSRYAASGSLTSSVFDAGAGVTWNGTIVWNETLPSGTEITIQTRTGTDPDPFANPGAWSGWSTPTSVASGGRITSPANRYIQYRANLYGNTTRTSTPVLDDVTLYNKPLETWDTTGLNGDYTVRLTVTNNGLNSITATTFVHVDNTTTAPVSTIADTVTTRSTDGFNTKDNDLWVYSATQTVPFSDGGENVVKSDATTIHDYTVNLYRRYYTLTSGSSVTVDFKVDNTNSGAVLALEGDAGTYYRWALIAGQKDGLNKLYVQYCEDGTNYFYPVDLINSMSLNTWYTASFKVNDSGNFEMEVYQKDTPSIRGSYSRAMPAGVSWRFHDWLMNGNAYLDNYKEEMHATANAFIKGTVGITGTSSDAFPGVEKVEFSIKNSSNQYWNGTGWTTAGTEAWLSTTSTSGAYATWSYSWDTNNANFPDGAYTLNSKATDLAGTVETALTDTVAVTVDNTAPAGSIAFPAASGYVSGGYVGVNGTVTETNPWRYISDYGSGASPTSWTQIGPVRSGLPGSAWSWLQTTDTDFNTGTKNNVQVNGTGSAGNVTLQANPSAIVTAKAWEFNSGVESWTVGYKVTPLTSDGVSLNGQTTEPDGGSTPPPYLPYIVSPTAVNTDAIANKIIKLKMKVSDNTVAGKLMWIKTGDTTWDDTKSTTFSYTNTTDFIEYTLNMTSVASWSGTITQIRFYPTTVQDARFYIDYLRIGRPGYSNGIFDSAVYDMGSAPSSWGNISWTQTVPGSTTMTIQTRTGNTATPDDTWSAWTTATSGLTVPSALNRYVQYRANMNTTDSGQTPTLSDITLSYNLTSVFEMWPTSSLSDGIYTVKVTVFDKAGNMTKLANSPITLDKTVPTAVMSALGYQGYIRGTVAVDGTATDNANFDHFDLKYSGTGSGDIGTNPHTPAPPGGTGTLDSWATPASSQAGDPYTIKLYVVDKANNTATATRAVTVDNNAPTATSATPTGDFVKTDANLRVNFNEKIKQSTLEPTNVPTNFHLRKTADTDELANWVTGTYSYIESGASYYATFDPTALLNVNIPYIGHVTTAVTDLAGNPLTADYVWNFTTADIEALISTPQPYGRLKGTVDIIGTASGSGFSSLDLTYSGASSGHIAHVAGPVASGTLTSPGWDTTALTDGPYTITLTVTDTLSRILTSDIQVTIDNTKPVSTTPAFTDMRDAFDTKDAAKWTYNSYQTVVDDDPGAGVSNVIRNTGQNNWAAEFYRTAYSISKGDTVSIDFKVTSATGHLNSGIEHYEGTAYYRFAVRHDPTTGKLYGQYNDGVTTYEQEILPSVTLNEWYVLTIKLSDTDGGNSEIKVYKKSDPYVSGTYSARIRSGESWRFNNKIYAGYAYHDNYQETVANGDFVSGKIKLKGTVTDSLSGARKTEFAILNGSSQYWTGSGNNWGGENWLTATGSGRVEDSIGLTGLVADWHLDENAGNSAADASGNGNTGTLVGSPAWVAGKYGSALTFNGSNYMSWSAAPTNSFTLETWVKATTTHEIDTESTSGTGGTANQKYLFGATSGGANAGAGVSVGTNGISVYEHGDGYMPALAVYSGSLGTDWNHIVVTYTNKQPRIYLNGVLVRTGLTSPKATVYAPVQLASGAYGSFAGTVDEVKTYNRALSNAEVVQRFNSGPAATIPNPDITYTGTWTTAADAGASAGSTRYSATADSTATYNFTGSSITWISSRATGRGIANVYIDNIFETAINLDGPTLSGVPVYTKTWGTSDAHSIKIEATGLPRIDIDAFDVGGDAGWSYIWNTASGAFADGNYTFKIRATDWAGNVQDTIPSLTVTVDNTNPQAVIASPAANGAGTATITITGKARDANFAGYYLFYGVGASPTSWTAIGTNPRTSPVGTDTENGELGPWNVSGLAEGNYTLRLTVIDRAGRVNVVDTTNKIYPIIVDKTAPYVEITDPKNEDYKVPPVSVSGKAFDYTVGGAKSDVVLANIDLKVIENVGTGSPVDRGWADVSGTPAAWTYIIASLPEGSHGLQARAIDNAGNVRLSNWVYIIIDTTGPPTAVLRGIADRNTGVISLSWTPVRDLGIGVDYYIIKRGGSTMTAGLKYYDNNPMEEIDTDGRFYASNAKDATIDPNATYSYSYQVIAYDYLGNASQPSNSATVKYDSEPPTQPMNLTASPAGNANAIYLKWSQSTDNLGTPPDKKPVEYRVFRIAGESGSPYTGNINTNLIAVCTTAGQNSAPSFFDGDLTSGGIYRYQVVAYDEALNASPVSDVVQTAAGDPPPEGYGQPHVTFTANPDQCVMCHRTHTSQGKNLLQRYNEADLCFTCHDGTASVNPTKAEFDYSPNTGHRVKDDIWPSGKLSCIDCHNPHLNPISASFEDFEDDVPKPLGGGSYQYFAPDGWTVGSGSWRGEGDANATALAQNAGGTTYIHKDTGLDVKALGGNFATKFKFTSAGGHVFLTVGSAGASARSGVTADVNMNGVIQLRDGGTVQKEVDTGSALEQGRWYRLRMKIDSDRLTRIALLRINDDATETTVANSDFKDIAPSVFIKGATGDILELGTEGATAQFDNVKVNDVGMLMTRYRKYYRAGEDPNLYKISEDKLAGEEFCLACHGTNSDVPGGSHRQYYTSIHNPLVGSTATPRWWDIRASWKQIKQSSLGVDLKGTSNGCLYCHGYHGKQFYSITTAGEQELCYRCHGNAVNYYSRSNLNVYRQYNFQEETAKAILYSTGWSTESNAVFGSGGVKYSSTAGATASYTFVGTSSVTLYSTKRPTSASFKVYIDNVLQQTVTLQNDPIQYRVPVYTKSDLVSDVWHTLKVEVVSGRVDIDYFQGGGSRHGLTLREATIKCTSCHGQRAMTDRHIYEGTMSSMITNPFNIKAYWSQSRSAGMTMDDYCNSCHQESLPKETHTSTTIVPYTIKYPAMYTTSSANGFVRKGYSEKSTAAVTPENPQGYIVGHKAYTTTHTIVVTGVGTVTTCSGKEGDGCHADEPYKTDLTNRYSGVNIWTIPELNTQMNCLSCHDAHATSFERLVRWGEDYKTGAAVTKGRCLHCHDGSVTE